MPRHDDFEPIPNVVVDQFIEETYGKGLLREGFVSHPRRCWSRQRVSFARDLLQIQAMKGASISPRWGFSLPYVLEVRAGRLRWHRTAKAVVFDVIIDPVDVAEADQYDDWMLPQFGDRQRLRESLDVQAARVVLEAQATWGGVSTLEDLHALLCRLRERSFRRFGFYNYVQHPLALAFTLAKLGRCDDARLELAKCTHIDVPDIARQLNDALVRTTP